MMPLESKRQSLAERNREIVMLAMSGATTEQLAREFGLTTRRIRTILTENGISLRARSKLSHEDVAQIKLLLDQDVPVKEIARRYGVTAKSIYDIRGGKRRPLRKPRLAGSRWDSPPCRRALDTCAGKGCYLASACPAAARYWGKRGYAAAATSIGQDVAFDLFLNFHLEWGGAC